MGLHSDTRRIESIVLSGGPIYRVGSRGVDSISPYHENGEMASIVWFEVAKRDKGRRLFIAHRINSAHVQEVNYEE